MRRRQCTRSESPEMTLNARVQLNENFCAMRRFTFGRLPFGGFNRGKKKMPQAGKNIKTNQIEFFRLL